MPPTVVGLSFFTFCGVNVPRCFIVGINKSTFLCSSKGHVTTPLSCASHSEVTINLYHGQLGPRTKSLSILIQWNSYVLHKIVSAILPRHQLTFHSVIDMNHQIHKVVGHAFTTPSFIRGRLLMNWFCGNFLCCSNMFNTFLFSFLQYGQKKGVKCVCQGHVN